jgi:PKD repeat protein
MKTPRLVNILMVAALIMALFSTLGTPVVASTPGDSHPLGAERTPMAAESFQILTLSAENSVVVDHDAITGDDRGGIATSNTRLFYTGDSATGSFSLDDLSGGVSIGVQYDTLVSDLKTGQVYLLGNGGYEIPIYNGNQTVSQLLEVDGDTGALTGDIVTLDTPIVISTEYGAGLFAGYGRVLIYDPVNGAMWAIATPLGIVSALSYPGSLDMNACENWAFWGLAEHFGDEDYIVYRDAYANHDIVRTRLSDGDTTVLADFNDLSDMCSISANLGRGRWYFHYEGSGQFGGNAETIGYAEASFLIPSGSLNGHVYKAGTSDPIEGATITADWSETWTGADGYYTMTLSTGTYTLVAEHPQYTTAVLPNVEIIINELTTEDFYLTPRGRLFGTVTDFDSGLPLEATLTAEDGTTASSDPDTGAYEIYLNEGTHIVTATAENYIDVSASVEMVSSQDTQQDFVLQAQVAFFPSPVHVTLPWQTTDQLEATMLNRLAGSYDFEFTEDDGGFTPLMAPGDFTLLAPSPVPVTCVASDPKTGYIYAQENDGIKFYRYDPWNNSWMQLADSPLYSGNNGGARVLNGILYTVYTENGSEMGVYDIEMDSWSTLANGLGQGTGNIATDGEVLYLVNNYSFASYDPESDQWVPLAAPPIAFEEWGGLDYLNGILYGHSGNGSSDFASYELASDTWTTLPSLPGGAVLGSAIDPAAGVYYAYGDYVGANWYAFDTTTVTWTQSTIPFFILDDGGLAHVGRVGISGIYFVEGENGAGFGRFETLPYGGDIPWLAEAPSSGSVPAGDTLDLSLFFTATLSTGVNQPGDYYGTLVMIGDPRVEVPVTMSVEPAANMGKVSGTILDACTGKPLRALIEIASGDPITQTKSDRQTGEYTAWLVAGSYDLTFSAANYVSQSASVQIEAGGETPLDVSLVPDRPCAGLEPDLLEVWVLADTQVYTHFTGLDIINNGAQDVQFEIRELSGTVGMTIAASPSRSHNNSIPRSGPGRDGPVIPTQSNILAEDCVVAMVNGYGPETTELHNTLNELGYSWLDVASMQEAYDAGANVLIARYAGGWNPIAEEVEAWLNAGNGYIEMGDWGYWFPESYESVTGGTPLSITVADSSHPLVQGLPGAWSGLGYYVYDWDQNGLGYVNDINYPNIIEAQYSTLRERVVSAQEYGTGRAVYLGFNVYGSQAGPPDKRLFENAINWSGDCGIQDIPWVWESPITGTVPAGSSGNVDILFTSIVTDPLPLGTYTATLRVITNDPQAGSQYVPVIMHVVGDYIAPTASFELDTPVCLDKQVVFTNTTTPGIPPQTSYLWDFGDGITSTEVSPVHQYAAVGTYQVSLEACALGGPCDTFTATVEILPLAEANFSYEVYGPEVTFNNLSTDALTYAWNFGDEITSTEISPMHVYSEPITYTVSLIAINDCGIDTFTAQVKAEEFITPTASFESSSPVFLGDEMVFTNTSTAGFPLETTYIWDFGDGIMTTEENPTHLYAAVGLYEVSLIACNAEGMCNTFTATVEVLVKGYWIYLPVQYKAIP